MTDIPLPALLACGACLLAFAVLGNLFWEHRKDKR